MNRDEILKNSTICPLPFNHAYVGPTYERKLCCVSTKLDAFTAKPLDEYWNSEEMKQVRLDMINGKPVKNCESCYYKEKTGILSYRQQSLKHEETHGGHEQWLTEDAILEGLVETPSDFDYRTIHCNLSCNHCSPVYSSEHLRLREKNIEDGMLVSNGNSFTIDKRFEESMLNELLQAVDERRLRRIYFAGGEPMMSPFHWKFIDHLKYVYENEDEEYIKRINMYYNTNLTKSTWKGQNVYQYLQFLNPFLDASLDGVGNTFNYIRKGANWDKVKENFESAYKYLVSHEGLYTDTFGVQPVLLSHTIFSIDEMLSFLEQYKDVKISPMTLLRELPQEKTNYYNPQPGFLDPCEFPSEIMLPAIDRALERVRISTVKGVEKCIPILENYKQEIAMHRSSAQKFEVLSFATTKIMEKNSSLTLNSLLKETNTEAWIWYNTLCDKYKDIDLNEYKLQDNLI